MAGALRESLDARSLEEIARALKGDPVGNLTRDEVLDNITRSPGWRTAGFPRAVSTERTTSASSTSASVPAAVSVFPRELYQAPRRWSEQAYPNLIYFNEVDKGNHFAAWQEPGLFTSEARAHFRPLRTNGGRHE